MCNDDNQKIRKIDTNEKGLKKITGADDVVLRLETAARFFRTHLAPSLRRTE